MKPQCETTADCLRELARVMDQFGIDNMIDAVTSKYVTAIKYGGHWGHKSMPNFLHPEDWKFAIAEVEGKLAFPYAELYLDSGRKFFPVYGKGGVLFNEDGFGYAIRLLSWNPPKPKTVTVEYTIEQVQRVIAALEDYKVPVAAFSALAVTKNALEELK